MNNVIAFLRLVSHYGKRQWYCGYVGVEDDSKIPHSIQGDLDNLTKEELIARLREKMK